MSRQPTSFLDGIITFDKPTGITSAKALYKVRAISGQRKSGHAGTLDPGASGVLVLCLGKATKLVESIMDQPKVYRCTARLDVTSHSHDSDSALVPYEVSHQPSADEVATALLSFEGEIEQTPPIISAIKIDGVPAYKRAARGQELKLKSRKVRIYWLIVHKYEWPCLDFEMACGRGTYVRSVIRDLGEKLGSGGCLTSLVRRQVGPFRLENSWSLERLEQAAGTSEYVTTLERSRELLAPDLIEIPQRPVVAL